ncbi:CPCC family cysteine-rich protein [Stenotrophomonas riyadhensis]|uniref:CPCC family cysteine-rich protein n=1 Tax=Stenotrophomonas riyadhensis TaxID=2859893 RepID=UPI0021E1046A|nr:CPCC family cysteine-rich protein [Stenotrophomonas sp. CFS3442]
MIDLPCPSCGFLTLEGFYGSFAICPICDWEDDGVLLANPTSVGGASGESLAQAQQKALFRLPIGVQALRSLKGRQALAQQGRLARGGGLLVELGRSLDLNPLWTQLMTFTNTHYCLNPDIVRAGD